MDERVDVREISAHDLDGLARLCEDELVLDRDARVLPKVLMRRQHIGVVANRGPVLLGTCWGSVKHVDGQDPEGFVDLLVVGRDHRLQGVGRRLLAEVEGRLAAMGCATVRLAGHPPHFAWPGVDIHYTPAICFAEDLGYVRGQCVVNMEVNLGLAPLDTQVEEDQLSRRGIEVRRAVPDDVGRLQGALVHTWGPEWTAESTSALRHSRAGVYVALQGERCVGFCAYGVNRSHEVGPMGTEPDMRKGGIGGVLLKRCLTAQRDLGLATADLEWVGPLSSASRGLGATIGRAFWQYEKRITAFGGIAVRESV